MQYITYKDIRHVDLLDYFAKKYNVKRRVLETLVDMCHQWGAPRTHEVLQVTQPLTYRQVRYIYRCTLLHKDLLFVLRPGGSISERAIVDRAKDRGWDDLTCENGELKIKGSYRTLVFRKS